MNNILYISIFYELYLPLYYNFFGRGGIQILLYQFQYKIPFFYKKNYKILNLWELSS